MEAAEVEKPAPVEAGIWDRAGARLVDLLVFAFLGRLVCLYVEYVCFGGFERVGPWGVYLSWVFAPAALFLLWLALFPGLLHWKGTSVAKRFFGFAVCQNGRKPSLGRAFLREAVLLSALLPAAVAVVVVSALTNGATSERQIAHGLEMGFVSFWPPAGLWVLVWLLVRRAYGAFPHDLAGRTSVVRTDRRMSGPSRWW